MAAEGHVWSKFIQFLEDFCGKVETGKQPRVRGRVAPGSGGFTASSNAKVIRRAVTGLFRARRLRTQEACSPARAMRWRLLAGRQKGGDSSRRGLL